jgi:transketolase
MRSQFTKSIIDIFKKNKKILLILGDIGVFGFKDLIKKKNSRAINIGILEQATISFAAGLSKIGFIPIVHTIATFMVNRAFEQLKLDFGYQKLNGNFISIGASYDYAALGCSHHCPEDVNLMKNIPNMQIIIPGNSSEFHQLFTQSYKKKLPKYFRLSIEENVFTSKIAYGKAQILNQGKNITVFAIGPVLNFVLEECKKFNLNLIYYTTVRPFDYKILDKIRNKTKKIIIVEPFYCGSITNEVLSYYKKDNLKIESISIPYKFLDKYGLKKEHDENLGFSIKNFQKKIVTMLKF